MTIRKDKFDKFVEIQEALNQRNYRKVSLKISEMQRKLRNFNPKSTDRSFELWYLANFTDFDKQVEVVRKATLHALKTYKKRLWQNKVRYFDHRLFLTQLLAYETEAFYPAYWFMSQDRYFSNKMVERITEENKEGLKIFEYSDFYRAFPNFDQMLAKEEEDMQKYLQIGAYGEDKGGINKQPLIPYSYAELKPEAAIEILNNFQLDDVTMDVDTDREVRAFRRFLQRVRAKEIYLIARFEEIPFGQYKNND